MNGQLNTYQLTFDLKETNTLNTFTHRANLSVCLSVCQSVQFVLKLILADLKLAEKNMCMVLFIWTLGSIVILAE